jgi:hypothetical protein
MPTTSIDQILDKLIQDVESSVHSLYRGDVRQNTQRIRAGSLRNNAKQELLAAIAATAQTTGPAPTPSKAITTLTAEEVVAATRCVMAWLPIGPSNSAAAGSKCIAAAREVAPTWSERERARLALKRAAD